MFELSYNVAVLLIDCFENKRAKRTINPPGQRGRAKRWGMLARAFTAHNKARFQKIKHGGLLMAHPHALRAPPLARGIYRSLRSLFFKTIS